MEPLARYGFRCSTVGCWQADRLVGGALFRSYGLSLAQTTVTECLDGPIFLEWDGAWADDFVAGVEQLAKQAGSMAVVFRDCPQEQVHGDLLRAFRSRGHQMALARGTADAVLPLEGRTIDQIRKGFNHGTRGRIRKAIAGSLSVRHLTAPPDLEMAYGTWLATAARKSFTDVRPWFGLEPVMRHVIDQGLGSIYGVLLGDKLLAAAFVVRVGKGAAYVYGGYVNGAEQYSPSHVLQFEAIRESLERGMASYNFGRLISEGREAGRGVDEFKLGFGAIAQRHLDTLVWQRRPLLHRVIQQIRESRIGGRLEARLRAMLVGRGNQE